MANKFYRLSSVLLLSAILWLQGGATLDAAVTSEGLAQQQTTQSCQGVVKDSAGEVVIGASVQVKGTLQGTATDLNGRFSIANVKLGSTLVISSIGYKTAEVVYRGKPLSITLAEDSKGLDEVLIVGYTAQRKESLTGSLQTIKSEKLKDITTPSVENMLNGKMPGVYVAPGSGRPGTRGAVVIRGQATLSGATAPLWVIDGVIVGNSPGQINPDDIETLTVLKDAASTAIYGSQGANGVIVMTTKAGKQGKFSISASAKFGGSRLNNGNLRVMNGAELYDYYASFQNASAIKFTRWTPKLREDNFDWWASSTHTGINQEYNVSMQGGNEQLQSYLSVGYYRETGAVKGFDFDRYNFLFKSSYKPTPWLTIKPTVSGSLQGTEDRQRSVTDMYAKFPWDNPYLEDGTPVPHKYSGWVNAVTTNSLYDLQWNYGTSRNYEFNGGLDFDLKLTPWLTFASVNNFRYLLQAAHSYTDPRSNGGLSVKGRVSEWRTDHTRLYTSQMLRFSHNWRGHSLNGVAGYEFNEYTGTSLDVAGTGLVPGFALLNTTAKPERTKGGKSEWAVQSFLFNANYAYDNRYLAQLSLRRDGASNFGNKNKYGNFYSLSGGWNVHRERWFQYDAIDQLKLRLSYGTVGNRPTSLYPQYDLYSVASTYNEEPGSLITQIGNNELTWEKTRTFGIGADLGLWDNRLRLNLDYYIKNTDNILYQVPISGLTGVTSIWRNIGEMRNAGLEIGLGVDLISTKEFGWTIEANIGHNKNELVNLFKQLDKQGNYVVKPVIVGDGTGIAGSANRLLEIGKPVDTYYLKEWAGVNIKTGAPMWYIVERDETGKEKSRTTTSDYSKATLERTGSTSPKVFGGFSTNLYWRDWDFNVHFGYSLGGKIYNYSRQEYDSDGTYTDRNQMVLHKGWSRWKNEGDQATHPIAKYNNQDKGNAPSSRYLESSDFLKLRSLTLGYTIRLPQYRVKSLRLFLSGENLLTWTDYSGVDPEIPTLDSGAIIGTATPSVYPSTRKLIFGLNLTL